MQRAVAVAVLLVASLVAAPAGATLVVDPAGGTVAPAVQRASEPGALGGRASAGTAQSPQESTAAPTIRKSIELHLTPGAVGEIDVRLQYEIPEAVTSLSVELPGDARDVETADFAATPDDYEWDGEGDGATVRMTLPANETTRGQLSRAVAQEGSYSFVDAGQWAMVTVPGLRTGWSWRRADSVDIAETVSVAGDGSTGGEIAYLGDVREYTRTANGQTFTLAVPGTASMRESPADVLDALAASSSQFRVGARDPEVWFGVAPAGVDWGVRGVEFGGSDAWVLADSTLADPGNVWLHEYVHTRQAYGAADSGRWTVEAAAEYYAAKLALELGYVSFDSFRSYLAHGERTPWRDAVLADQDTWTSGANYVKGSLVWGAIDRRIRLATGSSATMSDVLWRLNRHDDRVTNGDVVAAVRAESTAAVAEYASRHTTTRAAPEMWSRAEHDEAFETEPPLLRYDDAQYRVTGPYRTATFEEPPALYVGETLTVEATVTNDGGVAGTYVATVTLGDRTVASARDDLPPGESATLALQHAFADPGTYNLTVGRNPVSLVVEQPGAPNVAALSVSPGRVAPGERVTVTATLAAPDDGPANGSVPVTLDGETVATLQARLDAGESVTRAANVTLPEAGTYEVAAGDRTATVEVRESGVQVPGFGVAVAALALAATALFALRDR